MRERPRPAHRAREAAVSLGWMGCVPGAWPGRVRGRGRYQPDDVGAGVVRRTGAVP